MCVKSCVSCYGKVSEWPGALCTSHGGYGLAGVLRGKKVRTTVSRKVVAAGDRVNRQFVAERPEQLWVADDFTYISTWQGFVYVAFIIDVFAGYIVGWRLSSSMETTFVLDALKQALWARRPFGTNPLQRVHVI